MPSALQAKDRISRTVLKLLLGFLSVFKSVYTIILFERSPREFYTYSQEYRHFFEQKSDTGLKLELLQKYIFVPLDIFRKNLHNKNIGNKLEAWLAFLCEDDPEIIVKLIEDWPEFKLMYEEVYTQRAYHNLCPAGG